jgi:hypothetical protein
MTTDEKIVPLEALATTEVALTVTTLNADALDRYLMELPVERVAEFALRVTAVVKIAGQAKQYAIARLTQMGNVGQVFRDPVDGTPYLFTGGRHRRIKDVSGFVEQLAADGIDARPLIPWLSSNAFKVGETIEGDERIKEAVKEWAVWEDAPLGLVELDPRTMKPVRR